jgi:hypothetical protein
MMGFLNVNAKRADTQRKAEQFGQKIDLASGQTGERRLAEKEAVAEIAAPNAVRKLEIARADLVRQISRARAGSASQCRKMADKAEDLFWLDQAIALIRHERATGMG